MSTLESRVRRLEERMPSCVVCAGWPQIVRVSSIYDDEPAPLFPGLTDDAPERACVCGRAIQFLHIINRGPSTATAT
jgi:hypothetical protein